MKTTTATQSRKFVPAALALALLVMLCLGTALAQDTALTLDDAKSIALNHAQLNEADVVMTVMKEDLDDGRHEFEIEFISAGQEYEYNIDVATGAIRKSSTETVSGRKAELTNGQYLTMADAMDKAFAQAGVTAADATFLDIELDVDDGRAEYEVEFSVGGVTHKVELDAATGDVLKYETETGRGNG